MRSRHRIVEIESEQAERAPFDQSWIDETADLIQIEPDQIALGLVEIIDETTAPLPSFPDMPRQTAPKAPPSVRASAVPGERPTTVRPALPWGLGTDGWPRHNSRLVRLFACEPTEFIDGVAGRNWQALELDDRVRVGADSGSTLGAQPQVIAGELLMPYLSLPLAIELRCQPFQARFTRVDIVVVSHCRWPRRFFDVASRCLTEMQRLERPLESCS